MTDNNQTDACTCNQTCACPPSENICTCGPTCHCGVSCDCASAACNCDN